MARAPDKSSAAQFNATRYMQSWAANNPFYAGHVNWAYSTLDTTRTDAAIKSGVVNVASYSNVRPQDSGKDPNNPLNWANPRHSADVPYDRFGNVKKQQGDVELGLVLMGGYQFPGNAFQLSRTKLGTFVPNKLAAWMLKQGSAGYTPTGLRPRKYSEEYRERGWQSQLTHAITSNKGPGGIGQSSEDSTVEMYSTQETRMGTRAYFTNEVLDEETGKFGRTWAGFKPLSTHSQNAHYDSRLGQMFSSENQNTGAARRVPRSGL